MTPLAYEPHWEMYTQKQHLVVSEDVSGETWFIACRPQSGLRRRDFTTGDYERGVDRCRSCDRSAT